MLFDNKHERLLTGGSCFEVEGGDREKDREREFMTEPFLRERRERKGGGERKRI